jgi:hypothetical protein
VCVVLVLLSLIPVLSGYVVYLVIVAFANDAPIGLQLLVLAGLATLFGACIGQLLRYWRVQRRDSTQPDES